jgi:O-antigen ligase
MELVLVMIAAVAAVWGALFARRASVWMATALCMALGYVLGPPLWTLHAGPIPLTCDRVLFVGLAAMGAWHWRQGKLTPGSMTGYDWLLVAALAYFTVRCALSGSPPPREGAVVKPVWKLIAAFWVPAAIYFAARVAPPSERAWRAALGTLTAVGCFLAFTAFAEIGKQWWAVFPHYIANPLLGTHFGRARGPALNSMSLGVFVTVCFWAAWMLVPRASRAQQLGLVAALATMTGAVFFTYTRSTWMGLAGGLALAPLWQMPPRWRLPAALGVATCGALAVAVLGPAITDLKRKDADASAEHSVYQRASFVYVSARMFRDKPVFGCGMGRFFDQKMPYLADRSQQLELESLRTLDHHNTLLSLLVETGFVGLGLFLALLAGWTRAAWRLARDATRQPWQRSQGLFALATIVTYLASAVFHDLTLSPTEHWLLFFSAGMTVAALAAAPARVAVAATVEAPALPLRTSRGDQAWSPLSAQ